MDERTTAILEVLKGLPARTLIATMRNPRSASERTFVGASFFDYAVATRLFASKAGGGGLANGYFLVTAEDGARATIAVAEVWPEITSKDVMLAYEQDGEAIRNGVRLVLTGDGLAFRSLGGVVSIEPRAVEPVAPTTGGAVELRGLLERPGVIDAAALAALEPIDVTTVDATGHGGQSVPPRNYAGVRLYALLEAAGIRSNPEVNEDFMNKVIVATSADGHAVVIAGGEIEPRFQNGDVILATQHEGSALPAGEGLRLIVPFDRKPGRWAKDLVSIELREG